MKKLIYISDIDGTLLSSRTELTGFSSKVLTYLILQGVNVSVASLRSIISISNLFNSIPFKLPVIEMNGAFVTDFSSKQKLVVNSIDHDLKHDLLNAIKKLGLTPVVQCFHNNKDILYFDNLTNKGIECYFNYCMHNNDPRLNTALRQNDILAFDWIGITIIDTYDNVHAAYQSISKEFSSIYTNITESYQTPEFPWLTINSDKSNKRNDILKLKEYMHMHDFYTVVFGDQPVDIPMFEIADLGVAVENAHPEVKKQADLVIGNNDSDSVVKFIEAHYLRYN